MLNYKIIEHYKSEDEEYIKIIIQNIITNIVINEKENSIGY